MKLQHITLIATTALLATFGTTVQAQSLPVTHEYKLVMDRHVNDFRNHSNFAGYLVNEQGERISASLTVSCTVTQKIVRLESSIYKTIRRYDFDRSACESDKIEMRSRILTNQQIEWDLKLLITSGGSIFDRVLRQFTSSSVANLASDSNLAHYSLMSFEMCLTETTLSWDSGLIDENLVDAIMRICANPIARLEARNPNLSFFNVSDLQKLFRYADSLATGRKPAVPPTSLENVFKANEPSHIQAFHVIKSRIQEGATRAGY